MIQAGMLFRVSSVGQEDGYSLQDQEHDCQAYAAKQGYHIADEHIWNDGAQKSWTLHRPGLQAAIQAIRDGKIQVLIVGRYDRFSRVQMQQAVAIYEIENIHGGKVESADPKEQFGSDSTGILLRSVNAWRAEQELEYNDPEKLDNGSGTSKGQNG
ncbi:MAG: recombinase family protein [Ktedonobacteraceae bacterium]|nr:recombinase family protein [Ktedonobacteraceae bacterium]